jgi:GH24 family phage-related lysozyme (muramidase)
MSLLELIKAFEGCRLDAYLCPAGVWSIGYGFTTYMDGSAVKKGDKITQADADIMLQKKIEEFHSQVARIVPGTLPAGAVDALTSFAYNVGVAALQRSTLLKKIKTNKLDLKGIKAEFLRWNKAGNQVLPGLTNRRLKEYNLYCDSILSQYSKYELLYMQPPK